MNRYFFVGVYALFIALGALFVVHVQANGQKVYFGNKSYNAQVADTPAEQTKGLGGQNGLAKNEAMLFVFPDADQRCFWMKDMRFPIDIMWVGERQRIVHIERNVSPNTYPETFCPDVPAKYVIETAANVSRDAQVGDKIYIQY